MLLGTNLLCLKRKEKKGRGKRRHSFATVEKKNTSDCFGWRLPEDVKSSRKGVFGKGEAKRKGTVGEEQEEKVGRGGGRKKVLCPEQNTLKDDRAKREEWSNPHVEASRRNHRAKDEKREHLNTWQRYCHQFRTALHLLRGGRLWTKKKERERERFSRRYEKVEGEGAVICGCGTLVVKGNRTPGESVSNQKT